MKKLKSKIILGKDQKTFVDQERQYKAEFRNLST